MISAGGSTLSLQISVVLQGDRGTLEALQTTDGIR